MRLKYILQTRWLAIAGSLLLIIVTVKNIPNYNMIHVGGDEFGYWANAAYWSGKDWSSLMENTLYYSYGYSMLLFLITRLPVDMSTAYQIAIILNVLMLIAVYSLASYTIFLWFPDTKRVTADLIAFITTLYPSFITYTQLTYCETLIVLLYWLILINVIKLERTRKNSYGAAAVLFSFMAYVVHQRNLGVLCASVLVVGFNLARNKIKIQKIMLAGGAFFLLLLGSVWIKENVSSLVWISQNYVDGNNYSDMAVKAGSILSLSGINRLLVSAVGKLFYMASASFLLIFVGFAFGVASVAHEIKRKETLGCKYSVTWVMLSFIFSIGIATIFLINTERMDILIYGRYSESAAGALIMLGIYSLYQRAVSKKILVAIIVCYCVSVIFVSSHAGGFQGTELVSLTTTGLYRVMRDSTNYVETLYKVGLRTNIIVLFYICVNQKSRRVGLYTSLLLIGGIWMANANCVIQDTLLHSQQMYNERILPIAKKIQENEDIQHLIYVIENRDTSDKDYMDTNMNRLQYLLWDIPIERVEINKLDISDYEKGTYFILITYGDAYEEFRDRYQLDIIQETKVLTLFCY